MPGAMPCLCSGTKSRAPTEVEWIHGAASTLPVMRLVPCVAVPKRQCKTTLRSRYSRGRNTVLISRWCRRRSDYVARTCGYRILLARARSQHRLFRWASECEKLPATATATGMKFTLPHVDVVEAEIVILSSHDWSRRWPSAWVSKSFISRRRFRRTLGSVVSLSLMAKFVPLS